MKLDAVQGPALVANPHDLIFIRPCRHLEIGVGECVPPNDEAVVARRFEGVGQAFQLSCATPSG